MGTTRVRTATIGLLTSALIGATGLMAEANAYHGTIDSRCKYGRVVCVDKSTKTVRLVVNGKVKLSMAARFGSSRTPTRNGSFRVYWKNIDHVSSLFGSAMPFSMFFSGGQAIHYSSDFARNGYRGASKGCVNTRDWGKMKTLYHSTRVGDRVIVYWS